jgi:GDP-mannose 6-dehydrogenase
VLSGILPSNQIHVERVAERIVAEKRRRVALLGLSFKPGTDDLRESPLVTLAERLIGKGMLLSVHDADVRLSMLLGANKQYIEETIPHIGDLLVPSPEQAVRNADVIVVGQSVAAHWEAVYAGGHRDQLVVDLAGGADPARLSSRYWGVCW